MSRKIYNNRSRATADDINLSHAVDEVLNEYSKFEPELFFSTPVMKSFMMEKSEAQVTMKPENVVTNEMNAELWDRALTTSLADITGTYYPHYIVIQKFINYVLNSNFSDFGIIKMLFSKLLLFHPPNTSTMEKYYWHILNDKYVTLNNIIEEDKNIFWCVIEALASCLENPEDLVAIPDDYYEKRFSNIKTEILGLADSLNKNKDKKEDFLNSTGKLQTCFESLSSTDKFQRILIILEYLYEIFEADFSHRMRENQLNVKENRCFLSVILWENVNDIGVTTSSVRKLIHVFKLMEQSDLHYIQQVHRKLLTLLAEIIRFSDIRNSLYPFLGSNSNKLACDIALKFVECKFLAEAFTEDYKPEDMTPVRMLKPHWLRLLVCSKLLSYITGRLCSPELSDVHDILKHVMSLNIRRRVSRGTYRNKTYETRKRRKTEDNGYFNLGIQYCCSCCSLKKGKEGKRIRPLESNINALDEKGWAALHRAVLLGHEKCVEKLLNYQRSNRRRREILNVRFKGFKNFTPLMCAVVKEEGNICRLLLEHSGPELLEDVDIEGNTPFDLCQDREIAKIMKSFGRIKLSLENPRKFHFTSDDIHLVIDLCVQLVESYFITYRTRDIQARSKIHSPSSENLGRKKGDKESVRWDYSRYQKDIHVNIVRLKELLKKLEISKEINNSLEPLYLILNYDTKF